MDVQTTLNKIDQLIKLYAQTGNRQVLTNLRSHITQLTRKNPLLRLRIEAIFEQNSVSFSVW